MTSPPLPFLYPHRFPPSRHASVPPRFASVRSHLLLSRFSPLPLLLPPSLCSAYFSPAMLVTCPPFSSLSFPSLSLWLLSPPPTFPHPSSSALPSHFPFCCYSTFLPPSCFSPPQEHTPRLWFPLTCLSLALPLPNPTLLLALSPTPSLHLLVSWQRPHMLLLALKLSRKPALPQ